MTPGVHQFVVWVMGGADGGVRYVGSPTPPALASKWDHVKYKIVLTVDVKVSASSVRSQYSWDILKPNAALGDSLLTEMPADVDSTAVASALVAQAPWLQGNEFALQTLLKNPARGVGIGFDVLPTSVQPLVWGLVFVLFVVFALAFAKALSGRKMPDPGPKAP